GGGPFDDLVMRAARLDDQAAFEAGFGDGRCGFSGADVDAAHHSAASGRKAMLFSHCIQAPLQQRTPTGDILLKSAIGPEVAQRSRGRDESVIVAPERAVVLTR